MQVRVTVTTPRNTKIEFKSILECAEFFRGKVWDYKNYNWYTVGAIQGWLTKRETDFDGYKVEYSDGKRKKKIAAEN